MTDEKEKFMYDTFPDLYSEHTKDMSQTCMCWGFTHGDGWFEIIKDLSEKIVATGIKVKACQVKEKFGTLRYYVDFGEETSKEDVEKIYDLIGKAEAKTEVTCEDCGAPGILRGKGWVRTICDKCQAERDTAFDERVKQGI
jgi:hypothetical protein